MTRYLPVNVMHRLLPEVALFRDEPNPPGSGWSIDSSGGCMPLERPPTVTMTAACDGCVTAVSSEVVRPSPPEWHVGDTARS